jgi:hypothetical protein
LTGIERRESLINLYEASSKRRKKERKRKKEKALELAYPRIGIKLHQNLLKNKPIPVLE